MRVKDGYDLFQRMKAGGAVLPEGAAIVLPKREFDEILRELREMIEDHQVYEAAALERFTLYGIRYVRDPHNSLLDEPSNV